jgi:hypothetical protein
MPRLLIVAFWLSTVVPSAYADAPPAVPGAKVSRLIEDLGSRDFHLRDAATMALSRVGVEALPELQKARTSADPEVRRRLDELIPPLARKLALAPKLVTLHMTDRSIKDVLAELTRQTGYKIGAWPDEQPNGKDPQVYTFHLENVPFWQAMDQICEPGGLILQQGYGDDTLRVYSQDSYVPFTCYSGAFRVVAQGFTYNRNNQFGQVPRIGGIVQAGQARDNLQFSVMIAVEPRLPMLRAGQMRILEAVDDEHHSMVANNAPQMGDPFGRRYYYGGSYRSFLHNSQAPLFLASKTAQMVKKVRGVIPVTIVSAQKQIVVTERLLASKGKKFKAGGVTIQVEDVTEMPGKQYQFRISISEESKGGAEDGSLMQSFQQRLQVQDDKGVARQMNVMSISQSGNNHIQFSFMLMPQAGNVGVPNRLVYVNWETLDHEVPFEFHDLPLP